MAPDVGVGRPAPKYQPGKAAVDRLYLDDQNPRLPANAERTPEAILDWFLTDGTLINLIRSIATQGFFPGEPLLVAPLPDDPDATDPPEDYDTRDLVVVEGNRRLAAIRLLQNPELATRRQRLIEDLAANAVNKPEPDLPVIVFARRADVLDYLGYRHIAGIKEWDPLEKARYLRQLADRDEDVSGTRPTNAELAAAIGSSSTHVGRLLATLAAFERLEPFFREHGIEMEDLPFGVFYTAFNYKEIPKYLGLRSGADQTLADLDDERLRNLARYLFVLLDGNERTALGESRNMKFLAKALSVGPGQKALGAGKTVEEAAAATATPAAVFGAAVSESDRNLQIASDAASALNGHREEGDRKHLESIIALAGQILRRVWSTDTK